VSPSRHVARERATYPCPYSKMLLKDTSSSGIVIPCDYFTEGNMTGKQCQNIAQPGSHQDTRMLLYSVCAAW
jgi:hypothetical protein